MGAVMTQRTLHSARRGVSLVEILIGILIVVVASIGTLTYFAYGLGGIGKTGNRRAALERARQRLEQVLAANLSQLPALDGQSYWCSAGDPCATWVASAAPIAQTVAVADLSPQRMETTVQMIDDPAAGTGTATLDTLEFGVKVWFIPGSTADDDFHRVHLRTLRTP